MLPIRPLVLAALLLPLTPAAAFAAFATAAQNVNVRSGPGTGFGVIARLQQGDSVDVSKCQGSFCYISYATGQGWVSATYLTRDIVQKVTPNLIPDTPQVASATPTAPRTAPASPLITVAPSPGRVEDFPPAYIGEGAATPSIDEPDATAPDDEATTPDDTVVSPDDSTDMASAENGDDGGGVPRPKADIPNVAPPDLADDGYSPDDGQSFTPPSPGWRGNRDGGLRPDRFQRFGRFGYRRDFADYGPVGGAAKACFVDASGQPAFCVRPGERLTDVGLWSSRPLLLRNPAGLNVVVCSDPGGRDCDTYVDSGPVGFRGGRPIATVSADSPAD